MWADREHTHLFFTDDIPATLLFSFLHSINTHTHTHNRLLRNDRTHLETNGQDTIKGIKMVQKSIHVMLKHPNDKIAVD